MCHGEDRTRSVRRVDRIERGGNSVDIWLDDRSPNRWYWEHILGTSGMKATTIVELNDVVRII